MHPSHETKLIRCNNHRLLRSTKPTPEPAPSPLLAPGDIAIVQYNSYDVDDFAFVVLVQITVGTDIMFTNRGWLRTARFRFGEGVIKWTATTSISPGTVIEVQPRVSAASEGVVFKVTGHLNFKHWGDSLFAYQELSSNKVSLIFAINNQGSGWQWSAETTSNSADPLVLPAYAKLAMKEVRNTAYNGITSGDKLPLLEAISDRTNWIGANSGRFTAPDKFDVIIDPTALSAGDIAIVQYNSDGWDNFAFVALRQIVPSTVIMFTDQGWMRDGGFRNDEGLLQWTAQTSVDAGTIVKVMPRSEKSSSGDVTNVNEVAINFAGVGDQIIAYQKANSSVIIPIFAFNNQGDDWQWSASSRANSGDLIELPIYAKMAMMEVDNTAYTGTITTGTKRELLEAITDQSNWMGRDSGGQISTAASFSVL